MIMFMIITPKAKKINQHFTFFVLIWPKNTFQETSGFQFTPLLVGEFRSNWIVSLFVVILIAESKDYNRWLIIWLQVACYWKLLLKLHFGQPVIILT